jgi:FkbM family methyltransferase
VVKVICREAQESYKLDQVPLEAGDVVIDIGAHVGVISCYIAKAHPGVKVLAYEPVPENYLRLLRNVKANGVEGQVEAYNLAVTGDGRPVKLYGDQATNSGGYSAYVPGPTPVHVESTTLARILVEHSLERVKLLKVDAEGAEYEILTAADGVLDKVDWLAGEVHANMDLAAQGWTPGWLLNWLRIHVKPEQTFLSITRLGAL